MGDSADPTDGSDNPEFRSGRRLRRAKTHRTRCELALPLMRDHRLGHCRSGVAIDAVSSACVHVRPASEHRHTSLSESSYRICIAWQSAFLDVERRTSSAACE